MYNTKFAQSLIQYKEEDQFVIGADVIAYMNSIEYPMIMVDKILYYSSNPDVEANPIRYFTEVSYDIAGDKRYYGGKDVLAYDAAGICNIQGINYSIQMVLNVPHLNCVKFFKIVSIFKSNLCCFVS